MKCSAVNFRCASFGDWFRYILNIYHNLLYYYLLLISGVEQSNPTLWLLQLPPSTILTWLQKFSRNTFLYHRIKMRLNENQKYILWKVLFFEGIFSITDRALSELRQRSSLKKLIKTIIKLCLVYWLRYCVFSRPLSEIVSLVFIGPGWSSIPNSLHLWFRWIFLRF